MGFFSFSSFSFFSPSLPLLTFFFQKKKIIGLDSETVKDEHDQYMLLRRHLDSIQRDRRFQGSKIIFIPENQTGLEHSHMETFVWQHAGVRTYWQTDKKAGVCKTARVTREYQMLFISLLYGGFVRFDRDLFTNSENMTPTKIIALLKEQFERYHWEKKPAKDAHGKDRWALTGKSGDKQDDLLISVFMLGYWPRQAMADRDRLLEMDSRPIPMTHL